MNRRTFVSACGATALAGTLADRRRASAAPLPAPDQTLRIAPVKLELAPGKVVSTTAYNGTVPGPLLRLREGEPVTIEVINDTDAPELVHWHGLNIPAEVDGAMEEGTPMVPPHGSQRYTFTPRPTGSRWYHSHAAAGRDFKRATYSGQFGFLFVEPASDPGRFDQELFLALHDWDPYVSGGDDGFLSVSYKHVSINDKLLGAGEPIRVQNGQRVLFHFLNASATEAHWLMLPGHRFTVVALDGNAVPAPASVNQLRLDPGERIDAIVEMNQPGIWILGEPRDDVRRAGLGVVIEYAGRSGPPQWTAMAGSPWDYLLFGQSAAMISADNTAIEKIPLVFRSVFQGHGAFEHWSINGKQYPHTDVIQLTSGQRYRLVLDNRCAEDHPIHLHRHRVEIASIAGKKTSGILKDVVVVTAGSTAEVDFTANNPGKTLFHCHLQDHMDAGFLMLFDYR